MINNKYIQKYLKFIFTVAKVSQIYGKIAKFFIKQFLLLHLNALHKEKVAKRSSATLNKHEDIKREYKMKIYF